MNTPQIDSLEATIRELNIAIAGSEGWAASYAEQPEFFAQLLSQEADQDRAWRDYVRGLSKRVARYVDWTKYHDDLDSIQASEDSVASLEAYDVNVLFDGDGFDNDEQTQIQSIIREIYINGVALGWAAEFAKKTGTVTTIRQTVESPVYTEIQAQADAHIEQLGEWLDKTTANNVVRSIQESIALGENQELAVQRLMRYIDDPARANKIAKTETVRAYGIGRKSFALKNGAVSKTWHALPGADDGSKETPCLDNDGVTVDITDSFPSGDEMEPAHPFCRCGVDYNYADGSEEDDV